MRRLVFVLVVLFSVSLSGAPRESREDPGPRERVVKAVKRIIRALGDGLTIPTPAPAPKP